ncbi:MULTISPECIES: GntR family transcriptional regulator [Desulfococcus]|uniref:Transcriptional regulator, GntR family with UTRA sensor domain containing protein n=1 Tax=Desulfococcus multivorans DSM 2059 TaxID=1121405 RepID=S7TMF3_DESML|nr:GntR family transcriptional regulator [Desulfococcus multivorans]AOY59612.1 transcriptional regulator, GntR family [Desulfococcus multivorans]AQV01801.1 GntR family transcriptional regulator [Desulfococcus multivorans]EPR37900.1 transcriptional regulator, GntR family with UTRA sensor domain containing protein [Desulfococcus multivorans DSM 2059]SKA15931.1 transcriptional regulator, GntR family [Desulfococcus multivorans DSM 2059]
MLNPNAPKPLYHQLAEILLAKIRAGEYPPGSRIPSELMLAEIYGIGRPTVRQAVEVLVRKGLLSRKRGAGTFVQARKAAIDLFSLDGTTASFRKEGLSTTTRIIETIQLKTVSENPENPFGGKSAYVFQRLVEVEKIPVLLEDLYLHPTLFAGVDRFDLVNGSLSEIADEYYYMRPESARQHFRIGYLEDDRTVLLGVGKVTPLLVVNRFLNFPQADNAVYSELFCRTDRYVFSQTLGGLSHE